MTPESYGGAADLWGAALTPAIVNDPTFGFAVSINADSVRVFLYGPFTVTVYYTLSGSGTVAIIQSIVVDNEVAPGLALVTTTEPHGLAPEEYVSIVGVEPGTVANIASAQWVTGRQGAGRRDKPWRRLARHGRRQSAFGHADAGVDGRRRGAVARNHPARDGRAGSPDLDRRGAIRAGDGSHRGGAVLERGAAESDAGAIDSAQL